MNNDSEPEEAEENAPEEAKEAATEPVQENTPKADKVTQPPPQNAAEKFREQVESTQEIGDDYEPEEELWEAGYSAKDMVGMWIMLALGSVALLILPLFIEILT